MSVNEILVKPNEQEDDRSECSDGIEKPFLLVSQQRRVEFCQRRSHYSSYKSSASPCPSSFGPVSSAECYSTDFCSRSIKCQHPLMLSLSAIPSTLVTPLSLHNSCSAFLYVQPSATSPPPSALPPPFILALSHLPSSLFMLPMKLAARPCGGRTLCRPSGGICPVQRRNRDL